MEAIETKLPVLDKSAITFPVAKDQIEKYRGQYLGLLITGPDDKEGYNRVRSARLVVKGGRVAVENRRKELVAKSVDYCKTVNSRATDLKDALEEIEDILSVREKDYLEEVERIKKEAEKAAFARQQSRIESLKAVGMVYDSAGEGFHFQNQVVTIEDVRDLSDDEFEVIRLEIESLFITEQNLLAEAKRKEQEELDRIESERLAQVKQEAEARRVENERLAKIADEQREAQRLIDQQKAELKKQQDLIDAENKRLADAETARIAADAQAKREKELKKQAEADLLRKQEEKRIADEKKAARKLAIAPDKEKLTLLADTYDQIKFNLDFKSEEAGKLANAFRLSVRALIDGFRLRIDELE